STATAGYLAGTKYIDVYNGTYTEIVTPATNLGVTATENLIIQNHVGEAPIIDATGLNNGVYVGDLDYVTVSGFTIHSANDANIYTEGDFNVITYNQIYGSVAGSGVLLNNAATTSVSNCLIRENYNFGVRVISSNNAVIKNNTILNNGHSSKAPPLPGIYDAAELYIESGTGVDVSNNIIYANNAFVNFTLKTEPGVTVTSDYNTYFKNGNSFLVYYNGNVYADLTAWIGNGAGANDLETDPDFVNAANDWHIKSTAGSYAGGTWPPYAETGGAWVLDATTSPALDAGDPADPFVNEPQSGNLINQGAYGNTAQASKSVVVDIYWDGSVSTDWQLPANWTPEQVPGSGNNAIIPVGCPNYPIIDDGITTGVCFNLQIDAGGSLIIAPNGQMTVYGDIINNATAADFVIQSDATGDGSLIETTLAVQAQVQRFLPTAGSSEWHFFSSPITSAPIALFGVGTYDYDEIQDDWWTGPDYYFNVNSGWSDPPVNMLVANGYIWYGGQQTKTFQGDLNANVDYTIPLTYTVHPGLAANGNPYAIYDGWVLVGNPYPCALDWELIDITDDVTTTVYYYDDNIDNYAYYQVGGTSVNGGSQYIPSGQAFFIKTNDAVDGGSVVIPEYARTHNNQGFWKSKADKEVVRLKVSSGNYYDETLIQVSELASDDYMDNYDAFKHFSWNYLVPQIFTMNNDRTVNMSINSFNLDEFRKILPLGYKFAQAGEYEISITENTAKETFVIIKDIETENMTLVSEDDNYVITPSNNLTTDHLELILEKNLAPQIVDLLSDVQIDEFSGFKFVIPSDFYSDVNMFDQITVSASLPDGSELPAWIMFNSSDFSFSGNALGAQKIIVKMTVTDMFGYSAYTDFVVDVVGNPTIAQQVETNLLLYPSPTENFVYLQISGGQYDYDVQISTMNGAVVYEKNFTNKKTNVIDVSDFAAGVYMMTVIFDDNSTIVKKFIKK
ncbi:MAG: right-handed parallel beta-helix repeat-containing protein, partial [Bacteroidales bacterium]|nr:right-handed parallel beta-helix repeat-containing protein [Bacteroidales bacterium]